MSLDVAACGTCGIDETGWAHSDNAKVEGGFLELGQGDHNVARAVAGLVPLKRYRLRFEAKTSPACQAAKLVARVDNVPVFGERTSIVLGETRECQACFVPALTMSLLRFENGSP